MNLYRIARPIYADDISGLGASKTPGRWNKAGESTLYTAENPAQCLIEVLAHTTSACLPALKLVKLYLPGIEISDLKLVALSDLPDGWDSPIPLPTTQALGSRLMMVERCIGIVVPSVLVPDGRNVVLNPEHPALLQMKMEWSKDFSIDQRLKD